MDHNPRGGLSLLLIDNHDSFTGILAHLITESTGAAPAIIAQDDPLLSPALIAGHDAVIISPGPGDPHSAADVAGSAMAVAQTQVPVLGVCLGMQAIAIAAGATVSRAPHPMHGRSSLINGFAGIDGPLEVTRYHSLAVDPESVPDSLHITSRAEDGTIMACRRSDAPQYGVQFHPESAGTRRGVEIIRAIFHDLGLALPPRPQWDSRFLARAGQLPRLVAELDRQASALAWLDSADSTHPTGQRSVVAADLGTGWSGQLELPAQENLLAAPAAVEVSGGGGFQPGHFGVVDYSGTAALLLIPDVVLVEEAGEIWLYLREGAQVPDLENLPEPVPAPAPELAASPRADLSRPGYLAAVDNCREHIAAGDSYELCLTTTVRAEFADTPDALGLYLRLREQSPAPMAGYWRIAGTVILSASPERFLAVDHHRMVRVSPIKGTRGRGSTPETDAQLRTELSGSVKDRAENQMIVDLMRHDLSQFCETGTVTVPELCQVHTFATGHQLISTVSGRLHSEVPAAKVVRGCLPPGSMTGAPKKRTVELLAELEPEPRGWYSGVAGHITADGTADFSVLIRSVILSGTQLSYGAGGAVTALSDPVDEADEVQVKLLPLRRLLGFSDSPDTWLKDWT